MVPPKATSGHACFHSIAAIRPRVNNATTWIKFHECPSFAVNLILVSFPRLEAPKQRGLRPAGRRQDWYEEEANLPFLAEIIVTFEKIVELGSNFHGQFPDFDQRVGANSDGQSELIRFPVVADVGRTANIGRSVDAITDNVLKIRQVDIRTIRHA